MGIKYKNSHYYQSRCPAKEKKLNKSIKWAKAVAVFFFINFCHFIPFKAKAPNPNGYKRNYNKKCHNYPFFFSNYTTKGLAI